MRRKVRRRRKPILVPILLLLAVIAGACCCLIPYMEAQSTMPADGILTIEEQKDGSFLLHWPKAERTDYYQVEILNPPVGENDPEPVWVDRVKVGEQIFLPQLPTESEYIIRVNTVVEYSIFGKVLARIGDEPLTAVTVLRAPRIVEFQWDADTDKKVVSVTYEMMDADYAVFYRDLSEEMEKYNGKTVRFKGIVARDPKMPADCVLAGRHVMTCCADDIAFHPLVCIFSAPTNLNTRDWVTFTGIIKIEKHKLYRGEGPVLYVTATEFAVPPAQEVATFY